MSDKKDVVDEKDLTEEEALKYVHQNRRYVGTKETVAYVLNDFSNGFNISKYGNLGNHKKKKLLTAYLHKYH